MPKLTPTVVDKNTLGDVLFDGVRKRPVLAENDDGEQVVCCRRTAKTNGWTILETAYSRAGEPKTAKEDFAEDPPAKAKGKPKPTTKNKHKLSAEDMDALL